MPFGAGFTLKLRNASFRQKLVQDMQGVAEGRVTNQSNSSLIQNFSSTYTGVSSITRNGAFIASVGGTFVGDITEKVGYPTTFTLGG